MKRTLANMNAWMLDWKDFMVTLLNESDEPQASRPEPRHTAHFGLSHRSVSQTPQHSLDRRARRALASH